MAHFYFHLHECGNVVADEEGRDAADLAAARDMAVRAARDVMCAEVKAGRLCMSCRIIIEDAQHRTVDQVAFKDAIALSGL